MIKCFQVWLSIFNLRRYTMGHRRMQNMAQPYKRQLFRFDLSTFAWVSRLGLSYTEICHLTCPNVRYGQTVRDRNFGESHPTFSHIFCNPV